jgi:hemoglobin-like flavoprotein
MTWEADLIRDSLDLVLAREPDLAGRFCEALFARYPASIPLLGRLHCHLLVDALRDVAAHLEDEPWLEQDLAWMGAHQADGGVTPDMYPWVAETLIAVLREVAGAGWTPAHEAVWREAYAGVVDLMAAGEAPAGQVSTAAWNPPVATAAGWTPSLDTRLTAFRRINLTEPSNPAQRHTASAWISG